MVQDNRWATGRWLTGRATTLFMVSLICTNLVNAQTRESQQETIDLPKPSEYRTLAPMPPGDASLPSPLPDPGGGLRGRTTYTSTPRPKAAQPESPGEAIQPIDLATALRLAGARDLDIATARQQVMQALGDLDEARGLWLPSLFTGPTYYRLDGQVQAINGKIMTVDRGSLFLGTTASLANSFPAAPRGAVSLPSTH